MKLPGFIRRRLIGLLSNLDAERQKLQFNDHVSKGNVTIGDHSYGYPEIIWDKHSNAKIQIGKFCSIAQQVHIYNGSNHNTKWISTYPSKIMFDLPGKYHDGHPFTNGDVVIGNDVWIASNVIILSGVTIGDGAVIGAGSVIRGSVAPYSIVTGNPATEVKKRYSHDQIAKLLTIKWWDWELPKIMESFPILNSEKIDEFISAHYHTT